MRKSILAKILITVAVVLIISDAVLLSLGFSSVYRTVHKNYVSYAKASADVAADMLHGVDMEKLQKDGAFSQYYKDVLEDLCRTNDLEYLYIYIPDSQGNTITYVLLIYGEGSRSEAETERTPGTVVEHELNDTEIRVWEEGKADGVVETDNRYGHVMTSYSVVYNKVGEACALVGADVSMDEAFEIFFKRYRIMFAAVVLSFVFILVVLTAVLKTRVLKPAKQISRRMNNFVTDRQSEFEKIEVKGSDEFAQMAKAFNYMAGEIDLYIRNINELTQERHRHETEIHIAENIQRGFLPAAEFANSKVRLAAAMYPAKYVGGDFYDYFCIDDDTICAVIADVSGKGISAALFMVRAITVLRQYAQLGYSPSEILFHTNNALSVNNPEQMFLTAFVGIYHGDTQKFIYANAGHNIPYVISDGLHKIDDAGGMMIGLFEDEVYKEGEIALKSGDTVFLYTDGVNEAVSCNKEFFGTDRLERILGKCSDEKCVEEVLAAVKEFEKDAMQSDDITMLSFCVLTDFTLCIKAVPENLSAVHNLILTNENIPESLKKRLCLMAEEIFINICSYAYDEEPGDVEIFLDVSDKIVMRFTDAGKAFNPLEQPIDIENYDVDTQVGGLGRFITFGSADTVDYDYINNKNILTLTKLFKEEQ